jgi:phosphatidylinositol-3,4,5-trisphosphate 3-phosphatase/dual-specificity protein phosphatase PTEN
MAGPAAAEAESLLDSLPSLSDGPVLAQSSSLSTKDQQSSLFLNSRSLASPGDGSQGPAKSTPMSGLSQWAKGFRTPLSSSQQSSSAAESTKPSSFSFVASGFGKRTPAKIPVVEAPDESTSSNAVVQEGNAFGTFTKGFLDSSRNAVKAVQLKARHLVSQNKRRYQVIPFCCVSRGWTLPTATFSYQVK